MGGKISVAVPDGLHAQSIFHMMAEREGSLIRFHQEIPADTKP